LGAASVIIGADPLAYVKRSLDVMADVLSDVFTTVMSTLPLPPGTDTLRKVEFCCVKLTEVLPKKTAEIVAGWSNWTPTVIPEVPEFGFTPSITGVGGVAPRNPVPAESTAMRAKPNRTMDELRLDLNFGCLLFRHRLGFLTRSDCAARDTKERMFCIRSPETSAIVRLFISSVAEINA
jgi:hypothetical protein